jgi:hypothetical protein
MRRREFITLSLAARKKRILATLPRPGHATGWPQASPRPYRAAPARQPGPERAADTLDEAKGRSGAPGHGEHL